MMYCTPYSVPNDVLFHLEQMTTDVLINVKLPRCMEIVCHSEICHPQIELIRLGQWNLTGKCMIEKDARMNQRSYVYVSWSSMMLIFGYAEAMKPE
jgi:hypothetical protein